MGGMLNKPITTKYVERYGNELTKIAVCSMQGYRMDMEDSHNVVYNANDHTENVSLFGVYDGHGGAAASEFLSQKLPEYVRKIKDIFDEEEITRTILELDEEFLQHQSREHGSTMCFVLSVPNKEEEGTFILHTVNVGDSRAMVVHADGTFEELSIDHKPSNEVERARIVYANGFVNNDRVDGNLALSRAIGDSVYKSNTSLKNTEQKVIAVPDYNRYVTKPGDVLFLACDGIYESVQDWDDVAEVVHRSLQAEKEKDGDEYDPVKVLEKVLDWSIDQESKDNHTAIIVDFVNGVNYVQKYPAKDVFPGPYHAYANNSTFKDAYIKDLNANGYTLDDIYEKLVAMETEKGLPTEISESGQDDSANPFLQQIINQVGFPGMSAFIKSMHHEEDDN